MTNTATTLNGKTEQTSAALKPGVWVYVITRTEQTYWGWVTARDADGLTLGYVNSDAEDAEFGEPMEKSHVFVPWASIVSVLTDDTYDYNPETDVGDGTNCLTANEAEEWCEQHRASKRQATPEPSARRVTVTRHDGTARVGHAQRVDAVGIRLFLDHQNADGKTYRRLSFIPWASVADVEWREPDMWLPNAADEKKQTD